jgi:hypothetical protein
MKAYIAAGIHLAALALLLHGDGDVVVPPALTQPIEPRYSAELEKTFLIDHAKIEVDVDREGHRFALASSSAIPDAVVQALSGARFKPGTRNGKPVPFKVELTMAVRSPLSTTVEQNLRRLWHPYSDELKVEVTAAYRGASPRTADQNPRRHWNPYIFDHRLNDDLKAGESLEPGEAVRAEETLAKNPPDMDTRAKLIAYYASKVGDKVENRSARLGHLMWLARNEPETDILGSPLVSVPGPGDPLQDEDGYRALGHVWLDQASGPGQSVAIVGNTTNFLRLMDPEAAERLLVPLAKKSDDAEVWLADVYALSGLGVRRVSLKTGSAILAGESLPADGFGLTARERLLSSTSNTRVLLAGLATVTAAGRSLAQAGHLPAGYSEFCQKLLQQGRSVYPDTSNSCETGPETWQDDFRTALLTGGAAQSHLFVNSAAQPRYPEAAKAEGITGSAEFTAVIGIDGKLHELALLRAPLALYQSSRDAALRWKFKPALLNGKPVAVIATIVMDYALTH